MEVFKAQTIIEPFRVKSVEPLSLLTREERARALKEANYNLFKLPSQKVLIDLLTDSGTSAMSAEQWACLQRGDESYAGSTSFQKFESEIKALTGFKYVIPTHQGRASEKLFFSVLASRRPESTLQRVPNNSHFDTTRANAEAAGFEAKDFPCREFFEIDQAHRFKGNMNLKELAAYVKTYREEIPVGFLTLTNNTCGGQPVSLENIESTAKLYKENDIPFYLDACRFAENVAFIHRDERPDLSPREIAQKIFRLADGASFSGKKDALTNIGGFLATNDDALIEDLNEMLILTEGFPTYGGLAGRDLEAMAQGLKEVLDPHYLQYRLAVTEYMGRSLDKKGVPWLRPAGGHAIYLDAKRFCDHLEWKDYPGQGLALSLYLEGGLRSCEIGSLMFGRQADGSEQAHPVELVRLAIPRRVYTQSHMDYVLELIDYVFQNRKQIKPVKILREPKRLRHFSADFSW